MDTAKMTKASQMNFVDHARAEWSFLEQTGASFSEIGPLSVSYKVSSEISVCIDFESYSMELDCTICQYNGRVVFHLENAYEYSIGEKMQTWTATNEDSLVRGLRTLAEKFREIQRSTADFLTPEYFSRLGEFNRVQILEYHDNEKLRKAESMATQHFRNKNWIGVVQVLNPWFSTIGGSLAKKYEYSLKQIKGSHIIR